MLDYVGGAGLAFLPVCSCKPLPPGNWAGLRAGLFLWGDDMSDTFKVDIVLRLTCEESEAADDELDALTEYVSDRMADGVSMSAIMQSLAETLVGLDELIAESLNETLH
jgi:hypothetical protein